jgi:hypothetical protein
MNNLGRGEKMISACAIFLVLSAVGWPAYGANGTECLDLTKERIESTLKKMNAPPAEILGIKKSPLEGICEIEVNNRGAAGIFYTDKALNYVIFGNLYDAKNVVNLTAASIQKLAVSVQKIQDQKRIDLARITVNEKLALGEKGAAKKVIVFSDPD